MSTQPGRPDYTDKFIFFNIKIYTIQSNYLSLTGIVLFLYALNTYLYISLSFLPSC